MKTLGETPNAPARGVQPLWTPPRRCRAGNVDSGEGWNDGRSKAVAPVQDKRKFFAALRMTQHMKVGYPS